MITLYKYRIVKKHTNTFQIQRSIFGLFGWKFLTSISYHGYENYIKRWECMGSDNTYPEQNDYKSKEEAEKHLIDYINRSKADYKEVTYYE